MRVNTVRVDTGVDVAFVFGPFKLIPRQQLLVRNNHPVKIGSRALDILRLLVTNAGDEICKNDLLEFAWPNVFVDDSNLKVHISSLRRVLEDTFPQSTYIATIAGRGYKFVAQVRTENVDAAYVLSNEQTLASSLPAPLSLIGRQSDLEGVARALDFTRLLTLVGPGGVGKTSLAIAVAHTKHDKFPDGVHFIDFSATDDSALVPYLLAMALGARGSSGDIGSTMVEYLQHKRTLIVLDNCEHVLHAVAVLVSQLLQAKISTCFLATSREALGVPGENVQRVEPLGLPQLAQLKHAREVRAYPAIELFISRGFEIAEYGTQDEDMHAIARLCQALDGLPLAIEIVAAKLAHLSVRELLTSVSEHISELRNENGTAHSRHQTLWATLDWSYNLLSKDEATLFRLLSVFTKSFEWSDVTAMARLVRFEPYQTTVVLGSLVAKSLICVELEGDQLRYRFLESTKSYGADKLLVSDVAQDANACHARILLSTFRQSEVEWLSADTGAWRARYEMRIGDLRKALDWCFGDKGDVLLGVDLAVSAIRFWDEQSSVFEQLFQVERAMHHCTSISDASKQMAALATSRAWTMTYMRRLHDETDSAWRTALTLSKVTDTIDLQLSAVSGYVNFFIWTGGYEQAIILIETFTELAVQTGDRATIQDGERTQALVEIQQGKLLHAQSNLERLSRDFDSGAPLSKITRYHLQRYVYTQGTLAFSKWLTGEPEWALATIQEMVRKTGQSSQLIAQSTVIAFVAMPLELLSGHLEDLKRYEVILRSNLQKENISFFEPIHRFYSSVVRQLEGDKTALDEMLSIVEGDIHDLFLVRVPMHLGVIAEALLAEGRCEEAEAILGRALVLQLKTKENWCLPELLRVKARILIAIGQHDLAATIFQRARNNAREIGARTLELRIFNEMAEVEKQVGYRETALNLL